MPMMTVLRAGWLTRVLKSRSEAAICAEARMPQWEARTRGRAAASPRAALITAHERASEARRSTGPVYAAAALGQFASPCFVARGRATLNGARSRSPGIQIRSPRLRLRLAQRHVRLGLPAPSRLAWLATCPSACGQTGALLAGAY